MRPVKEPKPRARAKRPGPHPDFGEETRSISRSAQKSSPCRCPRRAWTSVPWRQNVKDKQTRLPLRRFPCAAPLTALLARQPASGSMACDLMAPEILACHASSPDTVQRTGLFCQRPLDYQERKQELGLGHFEGRGWHGFHHDAALRIAIYGLPGFRMEPFSSLSPRRTSWATDRRAAAALPPARFLTPGVGTWSALSKIGCPVRLRPRPALRAA